MNLEQQLKQAAEPWLAEEPLSPERAEALVKLVHTLSRRPRSRWGTVAAAAAAAVLLVGVPVVTGIAADLPLIGPLISRMVVFDRGMEWANEQGYITPVGQQSTAKGYTFRVEGVMADAARTKIFWVIEGPNLSGAGYDIQVPSAPQRGWHIIHHNEMIDGRLVGSTTVGPLPEGKADIMLRLVEVAGVKGDWSVAFEASRTALDPLTRTVATAKKVEGEGYALTVQGVLFAPTETVVRVEGDAKGDIEILSAKLLADGVPVSPHAAVNYTKNESGLFGGKAQLIFDRVEGEPAELTLLIEELGQRERGGPVLDMTKPGATAEAEGSAFTVRSVVAQHRRTTVTLDVTGTDTYLTHRFDWVLSGAGGRVVMHPQSVAVPTGGSELVLTFEGELSKPEKLYAEHTVRTVARDLTVTLPTK
jgi:hypothetical protein